MLDDCDFHYNCKGCGGKGVVGGVYRSVVTCSDCGGFGFEQQKEQDLIEVVQTPQITKPPKQPKIKNKLSKHQTRWLKLCRKNGKHWANTQ
jgi:hypothetical protein